VRARTGSGKTLAYCLPILHKILSKTEESDDDNDEGFVKAIILVPTKELCAQVTKTIKGLTYYCDEIIFVATLGGGAHSNSSVLAKQQAMLRDRPNIIVSTPAGLLKHLKSDEGGVLERTLKLSVESLVIDEADLVLSFGYANDVSGIIKYLPKICQGFLMSATLSPELNSLKRIVLHSPAVLKLEEEHETQNNGSDSKKEGNLSQFYLPLPHKDKNLVLYVFLKLGVLRGKGLFFVNTVDNGYRLKLFFEQFHIRSTVLNAELPLKSRLNIIEQFNVGNFDFLIATDQSSHAKNQKQKDLSENDYIDEDTETEDDSKKRSSKKKSKRRKDGEYGAARGLDFQGVSFVVNVDFPNSIDSYVHRIGRTARGGAKGVALSLVDSNSDEQGEMLHLVQQSQPSLPMAPSTSTLHSVGIEDDSQPDTQYQPALLDFDLKEIEGFRYRVEDVSRAVTKFSVRETRAAELRSEILNSERLQGHFEENPSDLQILRHDRQATQTSKVQDHLKHVPKYLLPRGMHVVSIKRRRKRKFKSGGGVRRTDNDPLQSFDGDVQLDDIGGGDGDQNDSSFQDPMVDENESEPKPTKQKVQDKMLLSTSETGSSTSGRKSWKEKHSKGKFSNNRQKKKPRTEYGV